MLCLMMLSLKSLRQLHCCSEQHIWRSLWCILCDHLSCQDTGLFVLVKAKTDIFFCTLDATCVLTCVLLLCLTICPDNQFRMSILERLEQMERRMAEMASHQQPSSAGSGGGGGGTGGTGGGGGGGGGGVGGGGGGNNSQSQVKRNIMLLICALRNPVCM